MPESETVPTLADLRVTRPRVEARRIDRRQLSKKLGLATPAESPEDAPRPAPRRRKRDAFLSFFRPGDASLYKRKVVPPAVAVGVRVPVKLPVPYRDGAHLGVLVGGAKVPFSRAMHLTRRAMLMLELGGDSAIPEDRELLQPFPSRLLRHE